MNHRPGSLALVLALAFALPAQGQSYPAPTFQSLTLNADPSAAAQAARKGYVDAADGLRILSSSLGQPNGPAQLGSGGLLPVAQLPVGTAAGTIAAGDDSRITGALSAATATATYLPLAGGSLTGLVNVGTASANYVRLFGAPTGSGPGVSAQGSDANVSLVLSAKGTGSIYAASPMTLTTALSVPNGGTGGTTQATARTGLGLGGAAVLNVGTATGTVAAGDDSRITGALAAATAATTYAPLAGAAFTGFTSFAAGASVSNGLAANNVTISGPATAERITTYQTGGVNRFKTGIAAATEPGANAGSDYAIYRYADNGAYLGRAFAIARATGLMTLDAGANVNGFLTVGTGTFLGDNLLPVQINATAALPAFYAVNKNGAYGLLFGYDPSIPAGVIRNATTDPLNFVVNNTVQALSMTSDGNARFIGIATAATLRVGTTAGPTWTTGTGAPTSTQPVGSIYSRTDGALGSTFYVSRGGGTWAAAMGL